MGKSTISSFSKTSFTTGESVTITIASQNSSYTHKLAHSFGDIATLSAGTKTYKWTPTANSLASFFNEVPNLKTRPIDIYLYTYNGSTLVGRDARTLTVTLKESDGRPTAEIMYDMAPDDLLVLTDHRDMFGGLVSGIDTLSLYANPATYYGASVRQIVGEWCGQTVYPDSNGFLGFTAMTSNQNTTDHSPIYITVTDSRGYSSKYNVSIGSYDEPPIVFLNGNNTTPIVSYSAPKITSIDVDRCTSDKVISNDGTNLMVTLGMNVTSLHGNNQFAIGMWYKKSTDSSWTTFSQSWYLNGELDEDGYALSYGSQKNRLFCSATFEVGTSYDIKIRITDNFKYAEETIILSAAGTMMEFSSDGKSVIIGETSGAHLLLDENNLDIRKNGELLSRIEAKKTEDGETYSSIIFDSGAHYASITNYPNYVGINGLAIEDTDDLTIACGYYSPGFMDIDQNARIEMHSTKDQDGIHNNSTMELIIEGNGSIGVVGNIKFYDRYSDISIATFDIPAKFNEGYLIPVVNKNCNTMTSSGRYYMGVKSTNRPESTNGWLDVMADSDSNYCFQKYITYTGKIYSRTRSSGTWSSWIREYRGFSLYNNSSGTNGTIKLSETASNFGKIEVVYRTAANSYLSMVIHSPNGKRIGLVGGDGDSDYSYFYHTAYSISGTSMAVSTSSPSNYGKVFIKSRAQPIRTISNDIYITKVIGYK